MDPIHQFEITKFFVFGHIGGVEIAWTKSALFMLISLGIIALLMLGATSARAMVPGRLQGVAEMSYEFVAYTLQSTAGPEGMKFFPLVFSLFMFILTVNVFGLIPYTFAVTAQIIITVSLAMLVFVTVIVYGFWRHGLHFSQAVRAERNSDLYPAAGDLHRGALVPVASGFATAFACSPISWQATSP